MSITIPNHIDYIFSDKSTSEYDNFVWSKKNNQSRASIRVRIEKTQKNKSEETEYLDGIISESYFLQNYSKTYFSIKNFVITDSQRNNINVRDVQFDVYQNIELKAKFRERYIIGDNKIAMLLISAEPYDSDLIKNTDNIIDSFMLK